MPVDKKSNYIPSIDDPGNLFKWVIGFLVLLFLAWILTGGPERIEKEGTGPFIKPLDPVETGEVYPKK